MSTPEETTSPENETVPMQWTLPSAAGPRERPLWWALLLLLTLVAYVPAIRSNFIWDDNRHVTENKNLRDTQGLVNIWTQRGLINGGTPQYYPLTHTMYWLEYQAWGAEPLGYHLVNVLLHGISAILVWEILRRLKVPGAWAAAAIWALHPINIESVAWVSEGKNVLAGVCFFGAILAYLEGKGIGEGSGVGVQGSGKKSIPPLGWFGISLGLFVCALLSKTVACSMPAVMVLILWWKKELKAKDFAILLPFVVVGLALGLGTAQMEREYVGAVGPEWDQLTWVHRILIAGRALWFYAATLVMPVNQSFIYTRWDVGAAWQWVFPIGAVVAIGALVLSRKRLGDGPLVAVLYFAGTLVPALGFFNVYPMRYSFVADHFQYLSGLGLIVLAVVVLSKVLRSTPVAAVGTVMLIGALMGATWVRASAFYDEITLWQDTVAKNPECWMAHHNLGVALQKDAIEYLKANNPEAIAAAQSEMTEAEKQYKRTLEINPKHEWAHFGLGTLYMLERRMPEAKAELEKSIPNSPNPSQSYAQLGLLMVETHKFDEAEPYLRKALELEDRPLNKNRYIPIHLAETRIALAKILEAKNDMPDAEGLYRDALQIKPGNREARLRLGILLGAGGDIADAAEHFKYILRDHPEDFEAWKYLGNALAMKGDVRFGEMALQQSLKIKPDQKDVLATLELIHHPATMPTTRATTQAATRPATTTTSK